MRMDTTPRADSKRESTAVAGLDGVVAAETRLSRVDGARGELVIAGFAVEALAPKAEFEETVYLLWNDALPTSDELSSFRMRIAANRTLPTDGAIVGKRIDIEDDARFHYDLALGQLSTPAVPNRPLARFPCCICRFPHARHYCCTR